MTEDLKNNPAGAGAESEEQWQPQDGEAAFDLDALLEELAQYKDRVLRNAAELENFKRRTERDKQEFMKRATEGLLKDLLGVVDNLDRALDASQGEEAQAGSLQEGLELTRQEMLKVLTKHGLSQLESVGQPFNPELHEAVMQQENAEVDDNTVLMEMQKGYMHQGRLLRPAMVIVSKKPAGHRDKGTKININVH